MAIHSMQVKQQNKENVEAGTSIRKRLNKEIRSKNGVLRVLGLFNQSDCNIKILFEEIIKLLKENANIIELDLNEINALDSKDITLFNNFAIALRDSTTLKTLQLGYIFSILEEEEEPNRKEENECMKTILEALGNNTYLTTLTINPWECHLALVGRYLSTTKTLTDFDLSYETIREGEEEFCELIKGIDENKSLVSLSFSKRKISLEEMAELVTSIRNHPYLRSLKISLEEVTSREMTLLSMLLDNKLQTLSLSYWPQLPNDPMLDLKKMIPILSAIERSTTLTSLNITGNATSSMALELAEASLLAKSLKNNTTLTSLSLSYKNSQYPLKFDCIKVIFESLLSNKTLTALDFGKCEISPENIVNLANALKPNRALTTINLEFDLYQYKDKKSERKKEFKPLYALCERNARLKRNWADVCVSLAFCRANRNSQIKLSIFPLLLSIKGYAQLEKADINLGAFVDKTKYATNISQDTFINKSSLNSSALKRKSTSDHNGILANTVVFQYSDCSL